MSDGGFEVQPCDRKLLDMSEKPQPPGNRAIFRITLKSMLAVVAFVAMACALLLEHSELSRTRASLARYEAQQIPTTLGDDEFRVIVNPVLSTDHAIVIAYRIESSEDHFASIVSEGESNGGRARFDEPTALFVTEAVLLIDHSGDSLKVMPKVGGGSRIQCYTCSRGFLVGGSCLGL